MNELENIGSFILFGKANSYSDTGSVFLLKYKKEHYQIMSYPFFDYDTAVNFATKKTRSDKKLFR